MEFTQDNVCWLGMQWYNSSKRLPTVLEIMVGIQKEEKINQLEINFAENPKFTETLISNMMFIWKIIFKINVVADFSVPLTYE